MQIDIKTIISFLAVAFSNIKGNAESCEAIGASWRTQRSKYHRKTQSTPAVILERW